ncbi:unnamed protein product [Owenia fusiformis]|uniref:Chitin-binding type-4 domain-containing protein n=1 Tax=Owenia fusiformis TaxID=6347 RepID=A0A8S4N2X9_OWEFU|nr:unnamed protein product [Owenia fusiformis]
MKVFCIIAILVVSVDGHGRLWWPSGRSTLFRWGYDNPVNYNDNELFCGGFGHQQNVNDGKCGVCGDPWDGPWPNEAGGTYANGIIVANYEVGSVFDVTVELTANHWGFFEYRLCVNNNVTKVITHDCLDQNLLTIAGTSDTRFYVPDDLKRNYTVSVQLPSGLSCSQCVLQWRYKTANSWGIDPDGTECVGCGPQEEFYGCSDISVGSNDPVATTGTTTTVDTTPTSWTTATTTTGTTTTAGATTTVAAGTTTSATGTCYATEEYAGPGMDQWCIDNCAIGNCPATHCICE